MNILLVEDSYDDAALITDFLCEEENAPNIEHVSDGREALDYVLREGKFQNATLPDLILLDLGLPRMGGYEALRELKSHPLSASIPVIVLTTSHNPVDEANCKKLGADAFFSKPYNLQGYEDLVQQFVGREFPRLISGASTQSVWH